MQHSMNTRVHEDWVNQNFEWYRAIWMECGELIDHYGYKWWKKQVLDLPQVQLEVIDIWHFGLSALFSDGKSVEHLAEEIQKELNAHEPSGLDVRESTEALALHSLETHGFSPVLFWDLLLSVDLDFDPTPGMFTHNRLPGSSIVNVFVNQLPPPALIKPCLTASAQQRCSDCPNET